MQSPQNPETWISNLADLAIADAIDAYATLQARTARLDMISSEQQKTLSRPYHSARRFALELARSANHRVADAEALPT